MTVLTFSITRWAFPLVDSWVESCNAMILILLYRVPYPNYCLPTCTREGGIAIHSFCLPTPASKRQPNFKTVVVVSQ